MMNLMKDFTTEQAIYEAVREWKSTINEWVSNADNIHSFVNELPQILPNEEMCVLDRVTAGVILSMVYMTEDNIFWMPATRDCIAEVLNTPWCKQVFPIEIVDREDKLVERRLMKFA